MSGYGLTENYTTSDKLLYVELFTVAQNVCRASFKSMTKTKMPRVTDNMFCAGVIGGGKDSCAGDSGSAFVVQENGDLCAKGIVSWGVKECGKKGTFGVYTQVSRYLDWINKIMSEN